MLIVGGTVIITLCEFLCRAIFVRVTVAIRNIYWGVRYPVNHVSKFVTIEVPITEPSSIADFEVFSLGVGIVKRANTYTSEPSYRLSILPVANWYSHASYEVSTNCLSQVL